MTIPSWQLPPGVDRGLWDYFQATEMVANYDEQIRSSPLATADVAFCEKAFALPGKLVDLGCGTGRLCIQFAAKGYECVGVDLSEGMLARARENWNKSKSQGSITFVKGNLVDLSELPAGTFDHAACLFSTLGMVSGDVNRSNTIAHAARLMKPGGRFVLHVHNRYFRGLGWKLIFGQAVKSLFGNAGDLTMPQAYGGVPLTLHHFTLREATRLLERHGFEVREVLAVATDGKAARPWWQVYGWLILSEKLR
jgi:SAM-dependent methyltransferase